MLIRLLACFASVASIALATSCSSDKPAKVVTVTVAPSPHTSPARGASTGATASTASPTSASPSGTPTDVSKLNGTCDTLLPDYSISQAVGGAQLAGSDAFVVGKPEPAIGRRGYLNCRYGITGSGTAARAKVEVGISLYSSPDKAAARLAATVDDYTAHGASGRPVTVSGRSATMLTGGVGADYSVPLLVVASANRTVAVSVAPGAAAAGKAESGAVAVAALALQRTGG